MPTAGFPELLRVTINQLTTSSSSHLSLPLPSSSLCHSLSLHLKHSFSSASPFFPSYLLGLLLSCFISANRPVSVSSFPQIFLSFLNMCIITTFLSCLPVPPPNLLPLQNFLLLLSPRLSQLVCSLACHQFLGLCLLSSPPSDSNSLPHLPLS